MLEFLANNWSSILIGVILAAVIALIFVKLRRDKKKGKTTCGCGCGNCPSAGLCHKK